MKKPLVLLFALTLIVTALVPPADPLTQSLGGVFVVTVPLALLSGMATLYLNDRLLKVSRPGDRLWFGKGLFVGVAVAILAILVPVLIALENGLNLGELERLLWLSAPAIGGLFLPTGWFGLFGLAWAVLRMTSWMSRQLKSHQGTGLILA